MCSSENFLNLIMPACIKNASVAREAVNNFLKHYFLSEDESFGLMTACGEAIINVCEHAYKGKEEVGKLYVHGSVNHFKNKIIVSIKDDGSWLDLNVQLDHDIFEERGRGILMMQLLTDDVQFFSSILGGTVVVLYKNLKPAIENSDSLMSA